MKKTLSILITLSIIFTMLITVPLNVSAATSGKCGDNLNWAYVSGKLIITGSGDMYNSQPWSAYRSDIKTVNLPNGLTSIGSSAFEECTGLTSVTIGNSVTSIGYYAFCGCTGLKSVTIPDSVTTIGDSAFRGCSGLTKINWNAENVADFNSSNDVFYNAGKNGNGIDVVFGDNVKSIPAYCFYVTDSSYNPKIISITIGNSVLSIGSYAFAKITDLTSINVDSDNQYYLSLDGVLFNKDKTTLIRYSTEKSSSYEIPNSVTSIGNGAFWFCARLTSVTIPDSVTSIGDLAFTNCKGLTSMTIPNSVTTIGESAFASCTGLTSIEIPNGLTSIDYAAFAGCSGLTSVTIPNSVTTIGYYAFNGCSGLTSVTIPDSVTSIGDLAFNNCKGLTSMTIPNSVTSIGNGAFNSCYGLTSVTIGNSVTSIGNGAFWFCTRLTSVTIPDSVISIGHDAFNSCYGLTSVEIPNSVTTIGGGAFYETPWYNKQPGGLVYAGKVAYSYKGTMPGNTHIVLKDDTTCIAGVAFEGCTGLTSVEIPNSVTSIGDHAFRHCTGLTSVTIPNSVTTIGDYAFYNCSRLTSVTIGNGVTSIGNYAFSGCTKLKDVYYTGTETQWKKISIGSDNDELKKATIHYLSGFDLELTDIATNDSAMAVGTTVTMPASIQLKSFGTTFIPLSIFVNDENDVATVSYDYSKKPIYNGQKFSAQLDGIPAAMSSEYILITSFAQVSTGDYVWSPMMMASLDDPVLQ